MAPDPNPARDESSSTNAVAQAIVTPLTRAAIFLVVKINSDPGSPPRLAHGRNCWSSAKAL